MNGDYVVILLEDGAIVSLLAYGDGDDAARDYLGARAEGLDAHLFLLEGEQPGVELFPVLEVG